MTRFGQRLGGDGMSWCTALQLSLSCYGHLEPMPRCGRQGAVTQAAQISELLLGGSDSEGALHEWETLCYQSNLT